MLRNKKFTGLLGVSVVFLFVLYVILNTSWQQGLSRPIERRSAPLTLPVLTETPPETETVVQPTLVAASPQEPRSGPGIITGLVYKPDGYLAVGAVVEAQTSRSWRPVRGSDSKCKELVAEDGSFTLSGLSFEEYIVSAIDQTGCTAKRVRLATNAPEADITLVLKAGYATGGIVVSQGGEPVANARVVPYALNGEELPAYEGACYEVTSELDGTFLFPALPIGDWQLYVTAIGCAPELSPAVPAGTRDIVIRLSRGRKLYGIVRDAQTGEPVGGLTITVREHAVGVDPLHELTHPDGFFEFSALGPGLYIIDIMTQPYTLVGGPKRVQTADQPTYIELEVLTGGTVRGRVYDADTDAGIHGATLVATLQSSLYDSPWTALSTEEGFYEIVGLPEGDLTIRLGRGVPGYSSTSETKRIAGVVIVPGIVVDSIDFPLRRGVTVSGTVLSPDDRPVAGAEVRGEAPEWHEYAITGRDGVFVFADPPIGDKIVLSAVSALSLSKSVEISPVPANGVHDVVLKLTFPRKGIVAGTVVGQDGMPLRAAILAISEDIPFPAMPSVTRSDVQGRFTLVGLIPGRHRLLVTPGHGVQRHIASLNLQEGQVIRGLRLVYDLSLSAIQGSVTDLMGNPLRATIRVSSKILPSSIVHTRSDGTYSIDGVPYGTYVLQVSSKGYKTEVIDDVVAGSEETNVVLKAIPRIRGRVIDESGGMIRTFSLRTILRSLDSPHTFLPSTDFTRTVTNPEGQFALDLYPGTYRMEINAEGFAPQAIDFDTEDMAEDGELEIVLRHS